MTEQIIEKANPLVDETTEKLTAIVQALIPKNLNDIIRSNRDKSQLRLTTSEEIFELYQAITPDEPKDVIDNWNLITFYQPASDFSQVFLLGDIRSNGRNRITSEVTGIDLDKQLLVTKSGSLYQMGTPKNGDPNTDQLMMVCAAFHAWGFGKMLNVPYFIYGD